MNKKIILGIFAFVLKIGALLPVVPFSVDYNLLPTELNYKLFNFYFLFQFRSPFILFGHSFG